MKYFICGIMLFATSLAYGGSAVLNPVEPKELYDRIADSDRMIVKASPMDNEKVLFKSTSVHDLKSFGESLKINKPTPEEYFHCMCIGAPAIYFFKNGQETVRLTNHHGQSIRTSLWSSDVLITDIEKWMAWFDNHGITSVREEVERSRAQSQQSQKDREKWMSAMPKSIQPVWEDAFDSHGMVANIEPLSKALKEETPEVRLQILALLEWFGSGAGPWSGYPAYESAAQKMLLTYTTQEVLNAIMSTELTSAQIEGGARLFGGWQFNKQRPKDLKKVPRDMKEMFWEYVKKTQDKDKLGRAKSAFHNNWTLQP